MTTLSEAFGIGWERGADKSKVKRQLVLPVIVAIAVYLRLASDWLFPVAGLACVVWAGFLVATPLGIFAIGISLIVVRLLAEADSGVKKRG